MGEPVQTTREEWCVIRPERPTSTKWRRYAHVDWFRMAAVGPLSDVLLGFERRT